MTGDYPTHTNIESLSGYFELNLPVHLLEAGDIIQVACTLEDITITAGADYVRLTTTDGETLELSRDRVLTVRRPDPDDQLVRALVHHLATHTHHIDRAAVRELLQIVRDVDAGDAPESHTVTARSCSECERSL